MAVVRATRRPIEIRDYFANAPISQAQFFLALEDLALILNFIEEGKLSPDVCIQFIADFVKLLKTFTAAHAGESFWSEDNFYCLLPEDSWKHIVIPGRDGCIWYKLNEQYDYHLAKYVLMRA